MSRKVFCKCEVCKTEFMGLPDEGRCIDHRPKVVVILDETSDPNQKYRDIGELKIEPPNNKMIVAEINMRYPRGVCQKCGGILAKNSRSYCRRHETERVRAWRAKNKAAK